MSASFAYLNALCTSSLYSILSKLNRVYAVPVSCCAPHCNSANLLAWCSVNSLTCKPCISTGRPNSTSSSTILSKYSCAVKLLSYNTTPVASGISCIAESSCSFIEGNDNISPSNLGTKQYPHLLVQPRDEYITIFLFSGTNEYKGGSSSISWYSP